MLKKAVKLKLGKFSKQDIVDLCPEISLSSVEGVLRKLVEQGELKREGKGRSIKYINILKHCFNSGFNFLTFHYFLVKMAL